MISMPFRPFAPWAPRPYWGAPDVLPATRPFPSSGHLVIASCHSGKQNAQEYNKKVINTKLHGWLINWPSPVLARISKQFWVFKGEVSSRKTWWLKFRSNFDDYRHICPEIYTPLGTAWQQMRARLWRQRGVESNRYSRTFNMSGQNWENRW
jgi:hypothetical protein